MLHARDCPEKGIKTDFWVMHNETRDLVDAVFTDKIDTPVLENFEYYTVGNTLYKY